MRGAALAALFMLAACSTNPSAHAPLAGSSTPLAAASPSTSPTAAVIPNSCRLPVHWEIGSATSPPYSSHAGFLTIPGNGLTEDPDGVGFPRYLNGRWLPGGLGSPDGQQYVYGDRDYAIHLVDVATAYDRVIGGAGPWGGPAAFTSDGLYLNRVRITPSNFAGDMQTPLGLWLVDTAGGEPRKVGVSPDLMWSVAGKAAWGSDRPAGDPPGQGSNRLLRADLSGGAAVEWFHQPQANSVILVGFDGQGLPFVSDDRAVWHVTGPNQSVEVFRDTRFRPQGPLANDKRGTWFSGFGTFENTWASPVFLYSGSGRIEPAGEIPGARISVAGGCA